jgi:hypothetical protein
MSPNRALLLNLVCKGCSWPTVSRSTSCIVSVTSGNTRNNRITIFSGVIQHKNNGLNVAASAEHIAQELGNRFDDPRYYGKER